MCSTVTDIHVRAQVEVDLTDVRLVKAAELSEAADGRVFRAAVDLRKMCSALAG